MECNKMKEVKMGDKLSLKNISLHGKCDYKYVEVEVWQVARQVQRQHLQSTLCSPYPSVSC